MKKVLISVEGGLGKHIMFTALTKGLKDKYDEVNVVSPYPDIMAACKYIDKSFQSGMADLTELVYSDDCDIFSSNPYNHQDFIKKKLHILEAWAEQLNILTIKDRPVINTDLIDKNIKIETDKIISDLGDKYIVVQFCGGQSPIGNGVGEYKEVLKRNYYDAQELVNLIKEKYPEHKILNYSLPNEYGLNHSVKLQAPYIFYFNILKSADKIVCIDSSLQHMAAAVNKEAIVLWGETRPEHFGWKIHKNIVKDKQKGSPYFVALGPSIMNIEFENPKKIIDKI